MKKNAAILFLFLNGIFYLSLIIISVGKEKQVKLSKYKSGEIIKRIEKDTTRKVKYHVKINDD